MSCQHPEPRGIWVGAAARTCADFGCSLYAAKRVLEEARDLNTKMIEEKAKVGNGIALWCDSGHAFSERDPGRRTITVTVTDEEGLPKHETRQFCGGCSPTVDLMALPRTRPVEFDRPAQPQIGGSNG